MKMRQFVRILLFAAVLGVLATFTATDANAKKKDGKAKDTKTYPQAADADYKALQSKKELTGKLVSIDGVTITVRAEYPRYEANPKYKPPKLNAKDPGYALANQQN